MEGDSYRIERMGEAHLPDVRRLMREVLKKRVSLDWLRTKYDTRHTGCQYVGSIAYEGDLPISFYGAVPQVFTTPDGDRFLGCHVSESMTATAYQRRGLYKRLALTAYGWMRDAGVKVVYGFNSEATLIPCKKIGWSELDAMRGYWVGTGAIPSAKLWRRLPALQGWHARRVERTLERYAVPPQDFQNSNRGVGLAVEYSPAFFASKAFHRNFLVELGGVRFWLCVDAVVRVGDVHFEDAGQLIAGVEELGRLFRGLGLGRVLFQTYAGSRLDAALASRHTGFTSWIVGYLPLKEGFDFKGYRPSYADQDSF